MLYIFLSRSSSPSNFLNELLLIIFTFIGNHPIWEAALGIHKRLIKTWLWLLIEKLINGHHIRHRLERHYIAIDIKMVRWRFVQNYTGIFDEYGRFLSQKPKEQYPFPSDFLAVKFHTNLQWSQRQIRFVSETWN